MCSRDVDKAEAFYRRALAIREEVYGTEHVLVATTLFHLGNYSHYYSSLQHACTCRM